MKDLSVKAISIGLIFNIVGGMLVSSIFSVLWVALFFDGQLENFESEYAGATSVRVAMITIGLIFAFLSGYLCAHLAKREKVKNALALGILLTLFAVTFIALYPDAAPLWSQVMSLVLFLPLAYAGGKVNYVYANKNT